MSKSVPFRRLNPQEDMTTRVLRVVSSGNRAITRYQDEADLLTEICRIAVEVGGYKMAWVGFINNSDPDRSIFPVAFAGQDGGYLGIINVKWDNSALGKGPSGQSIRSKQAVVIQQIKKDTDFSPWRNAAERCGFGATVALPLLRPDTNEVFGVFRIYSENEYAFCDQEVALLTELGSDLSFGIQAKRACERLRITEESLRTSEERLRRLAFQDSLTGLPNRALYLDRLQQALSSCARAGHKTSVLFMDLNHFKDINDTCGHAAGDYALREVSVRLRTVLRVSDTVARLGGDEFAFVLPNTGTEGAVYVANRVLDALIDPVVVNNVSFHVGGSIGVAVSPDDGSDLESIVSHADIAMYQAKSRGGGYCLYRSEMSQAFAREIDLAHGLKQAIERNQFLMYYQPKIHLRSGEIVGMEALLRWKKGTSIYSSPDEFIPVAERRGLMCEVGGWVLVEACGQIKAWQDKGVRLPKMAINISSKQVVAPDFIQLVVATVGRCGISPSLIEFELTESAMISDHDLVSGTLRDLQQRGFSIAIDDYGVGQSSLGLLHKIPVDVLKIDKLFTQDMLTNAQSLAIVENIIATSKNLGIDVVAEGVESANQVSALAAMGCEIGQGYYFDRPQTAKLFELAWLTNGGGCDA